MKLFAVLMYVTDEEKSIRYRTNHLDYLARMRNEGNIFVHGRFTDGTGGMQIYRAHSLKVVEAYVQQDPFVVVGARTYKIHEWQCNYIDPKIYPQEV